MIVSFFGEERCLTSHVTANVEIQLEKEVPLELYKDIKQLGRFTLREGWTTVAAGIITEIGPATIISDSKKKTLSSSSLANTSTPSKQNFTGSQQQQQQQHSQK
jgi:sulfate adenylyltransferase subunit 1 (EFTu-like GTPase family)